jgi:hypothetical protein
MHRSDRIGTWKTPTRKAIILSSNVSDLGRTRERKDYMIDKTNAQEKLDSAPSNKRKSEIEFAIDLDQKKKANSNQRIKSKKGKNIKSISKSRLAAEASGESAFNVREMTILILTPAMKYREVCNTGYEFRIER